MTGEEHHEGSEQVEEPNLQVKSIRLQIKLDPTNPRQNIFNYADLVRHHTLQIQKSNPQIDNELNVQSVVEILDHSPENNTSDTNLPVVKTRRKKLNPEDEYDAEDDFIDDSEMFANELEDCDEPPTWDFGFFAWKGSVDTLFENTESANLKNAGLVNVQSSANAIVKPVKIDAVEQDGEVEKDKEKEKEKESPKKDKVKKSGKKKAEEGKNLKKKDLETPKSNRTDVIVIDDEPSKSQTPGSKKKKLEPSSTTKSTKKKPTKASTPKLDKKPSTIDLSTPAVPVADPSLGPLPIPLLDQLQLLRNARFMADFTVKSHFPSQLKPLFQSCVVTAMDYGVLNDTFFAHVTSILPYNTFTMRKLASRSVYPNRLSQFKHLLPTLYESLGERVSQTCADQNITEIVTPLNPTTEPDTPGKKYRFDEHTRILIWNILCLEWEMAEMDNEMKFDYLNINNRRLNKETPIYNELNVRKAVYMKVKLFLLIVDGIAVASRDD
ncbi:hypothetical protein HDV02_006049 [Globomyces sp. JEL0801]|nr:hypothetical protein HDV02_006049 [Globomyces sp. JEL0801]